MPIIFFCEDPLTPRTPDDAYQAEATAAEAEGLANAQINYEILVNENNAVRSVRRVPQQDEATLGIYRGWMMRPRHYALLEAALREKNVRLINDAAAYQHCHHLPESYPVIKDVTPQSVWISLPNASTVPMDEIVELLQPFGAGAVILKDFVKSQKHYWNEACFILDASDRSEVERVVKRFLELQGDSLNEGLVFREYVALEPLATHSKSGMPLTKEHRIFVLDGKPLLITDYWEEGDYQKEVPPADVFSEVMRKVQSRFFTMDVAKRKDGSWIVVELGDAQVSGLPASVDVRGFYRSLRERL